MIVTRTFCADLLTLMEPRPQMVVHAREKGLITASEADEAMFMIGGTVTLLMLLIDAFDEARNESGPIVLTPEKQKNLLLSLIIDSQENALMISERAMEKYKQESGDSEVIAEMEEKVRSAQQAIAKTKERFNV